MKNINDHIHSYRDMIAAALKDSGVIRAPIETEALLDLEETLKSDGLDLPPEYAEFLRQANGIFHKSLTFFGINEELGEYDLHAYNISIRTDEPKIMEQRIALGESADFILTYNQAACPSAAYEFLSSTSYSVQESFPSFSAMLLGTLDLINSTPSPDPTLRTAPQTKNKYRM